MVVSQKGHVGIKPTGGMYKASRKKRKAEMGRTPTHTKIGSAQKIKVIKTRGGDRKMKVLVVQVANVFDPKTKKFIKSAIKQVLESSANRHFVRRNVVVKGAIVQTDAGKARITSRPGQDGTVNAVLV